MRLVRATLVVLLLAGCPKPVEPCLFTQVTTAPVAANTCAFQR